MKKTRGSCLTVSNETVSNRYRYENGNNRVGFESTLLFYWPVITDRSGRAQYPLESKPLKRSTHQPEGGFEMRWDEVEQDLESS